MNPDAVKEEETIEKTIFAARLFTGFWDRWQAHGIETEAIQAFSKAVHNKEDWIHYFCRYADYHYKSAEEFEEKESMVIAANHYQLSGLYFDLVQWIFPGDSKTKSNWYKKSLAAFDQADSLRKDKCQKRNIQTEEGVFKGRIRIPSHPKGTVIIINPADSAKEELFTYENHFVELGFATVHFDGPGQGETLASFGIQASNSNWKRFVDNTIEFVYGELPDLPIYLFGTSSGANWSIAGSKHPLVRKAVAVSPAVSEGALPSYFTNRMKAMMEPESNQMLPDLQDLSDASPIYLFHGKEDTMVNDSDLYELFDRLPEGKKMIEYEEEAHCCNRKLPEIRELAAAWFAM
ncbi:alpha/beta hydrolase [Virgibacillus senegalensis]|uniref:alpha/beta hydrolase n=1 Tax=Virgibacillus senegalensis TaxID=1499679 RepID=UPI00069FAC55|nr:alpha/beta hydrolase [Virgibacillus senegalensis]